MSVTLTNLKFNFFKLWLHATSREIALLCRFKKVLFKGAIFDCKKKKNPTYPPPLLTTNSFYQLLWFFWRRWLQFESDYVPQLQLKFQSLHICFIYHHTEKLSYKSNFLFIGPKQRIRNNVSIEKEKSAKMKQLWCSL